MYTAHTTAGLGLRGRVVPWCEYVATVSPHRRGRWGFQLFRRISIIWRSFRNPPPDGVSVPVPNRLIWPRLGIAFVWAAKLEIFLSATVRYAPRSLRSLLARRLAPPGGHRRGIVDGALLADDVLPCPILAKRVNGDEFHKSKREGGLSCCSKQLGRLSRTPGLY